jgi:hypothetical protein
MIFLSAALWGIATAAFASSFAGWVGSLLAGIGAFLGALLPFANFACFHGRRSAVGGCSNSSRFRARLAFVITLAALALLALGIGYFGPFMPMSLSWSLVLPDGLSLAVAAAIASALARGLALRFPVMSIVEAGLLVLLSTRMLCLHRYDHLNQPFWMADYFAARGMVFNQYIGFGLFGLAAAMLLFTSILSAVQAGSRPRIRANRVSMIMGLAVFACLGAIAGMVLPMPSSLMAPGIPIVSQNQGSSQNEQKQDDQSGRDEPPLPPPPLPAVTGYVASIKFESDYKSPARLGALYFRYHVFSRYARFSLVESGSNAMVSAGWKGPSDFLNQNGSVGRLKTTVRTTVRMMQMLDVPIGLVSAWQGRRVPAPDLRFTEAWEVDSECPGWPVLDLNDFESTELMDPSWSANDMAEYLKGPDDPRFKELLVTIFSNVTADVSELCMGKRVCTVRDWIVSNCTYSAQSANPDQSLPDFLFKERRGGPRQYALATALLCRAAGVPARVANGFCGRIARNDVAITREFQVGDKQAFAWAEVYLPGCGWIPVDTAPPPSVQCEELAPAPIQFKNPIRSRHLLISGLLVLVGYGCLLMWRRWIHPLICFKSRQHVHAYVAAIDLLALVGFRRKYGETRAEFAGRVVETSRKAGHPPQLGTRFEVLTRMHLSTNRDKIIYQRSAWLKELMGLGWAVTRCVKCQEYNPLCWINADNPSEDTHRS